MAYLIISSLRLDICAAVSFLFAGDGTEQPQSQGTTHPRSLPKAICGLLSLWPLYLAARTPRPMDEDLLVWILSQLKDIGEMAGIESGKMLAKVLGAGEEINVENKRKEDQRLGDPHKKAELQL